MTTTKLLGVDIWGPSDNPTNTNVEGWGVGIVLPNIEATQKFRDEFLRNYDGCENVTMMNLEADFTTFQGYHVLLFRKDFKDILDALTALAIKYGGHLYPLSLSGELKISQMPLYPSWQAQDLIEWLTWI